MFGNENPNLIVPTAPAGDSSNRAASTQFVVQAIASSVVSSPSFTQVDFLAGGIGAPAVQDYNIVEALPFAVTLSSITAKCSTGTLTAVLKVNAATVTGGTLAVGTTQIATTCTAINTAALGSTVTLTMSVVTSAQNLSFTVKFTRALS